MIIDPEKTKIPHPHQLVIESERTSSSLTQIQIEGHGVHSLMGPIALS